MIKRLLLPPAAAALLAAAGLDLDPRQRAVLHARTEGWAAGLRLAAHALRATDEARAPYDNDALSQSLDERFSALFEREAHVLWVATGTAANCLALATLCPPHGGVVCHREAHIEVDEAGAPGFYLHGAKLLLAEGEGAKLTPEGVCAVTDPIRDDVGDEPAVAAPPHRLAAQHGDRARLAQHLGESVGELRRAGVGGVRRLGSELRGDRVAGLVEVAGDLEG